MAETNWREVAQELGFVRDNQPEWLNDYASNFSEFMGKLGEIPYNAIASVYGAVDNALTGSRDYNRSVEQAENLNEFNAIEAQKAREFSQSERILAQLYNTAEAQKNRDWQTYMSNTAFQRQVADIRKAGFNPLGMITGNGASIGTSATAHSVAGSAPVASATGAPAYNSATVVGNTVSALTYSATQLAKLASVNKTVSHVSNKATKSTLQKIIGLLGK